MSWQGFYRRTFLALLAIAIPSSCANVTDTCSTLADRHPGLILYPNQTSYNAINQNYFSAEEWLGPACIFTPSDANVMSFAVETIRDDNIPFAVKGGGWMPVPRTANINSTGILLSTSNITGVTLSSDKSYVSVSAGENWASIYTYLEPYGLTVIGCRVGVVGVSGFLLGGGMSFLSNEYGWASANVVGYEVILSCGTIVYATADNDYFDLYWGLRGGGNNLGIVTRFDLKTFAIPTVTVGQLSYGPGQREVFLQNLYRFSQNGVLDTRAFVLPTISYVPAASPNITYSAAIFYGDNNTSPEALGDFVPPNAAPTSNTFAARTMANWSAESDQGYDQVHGQNFRFHGFSMLADLDAMYAVHDIFFRYAEERGPNITGFISTLAMNAVSESYITAGRGEDPSGDPMGIDVSGAPYFFCEETISWSNQADTALIEQLILDINAELDSTLGDIIIPFTYLNNAGGDQDVFEHYDSTNLARLISVRDKYDPIHLYRNGLVGGFKLPLA